jgi:methylmalonyl-CoA mutase N-terminal domain/subunit
VANGTNSSTPNWTHHDRSEPAPLPRIAAPLRWFLRRMTAGPAVAAFESGHGQPPTPVEAADIRAWVLRTVRGTVQADIHKEDQGQNTCILIVHQ